MPISQHPIPRLRRSIFVGLFLVVVALAGWNLLPGHSVSAQGSIPGGTLPNSIGQEIFIPLAFNQIDGEAQFDPK